MMESLQKGLSGAEGSQACVSWEAHTVKGSCLKNCADGNTVGATVDHHGIVHCMHRTMKSYIKGFQTAVIEVTVRQMPVTVTTVTTR